MDLSSHLEEDSIITERIEIKSIVVVVMLNILPAIALLHHLMVSNLLHLHVDHMGIILIPNPITHQCMILTW